MTIPPRNPDETLHYHAGKSPVSIGRYSYGFRKMRVLEWGEGAALSIGSFCSIADGVTIFLGGNHRADWITTFPFGHIFADQLGGREIKGHPATKGDVTIGNDVWLAGGATVMSGVTIADGAIVGANAHVVHDVPAYAIVAGNPATVIKSRFTEEVVALLLHLRWWDLPASDIRALAPFLSGAPEAARLKEWILKYRT